MTEKPEPKRSHHAGAGAAPPPPKPADAPLAGDVKTVAAGVAGAGAGGPLVAGRIVLLRLPDRAGALRLRPAVVVEVNNGVPDLHVFLGANDKDVSHDGAWIWPVAVAQGGEVREWSWPARA